MRIKLKRLFQNKGLQKVFWIMIILLMWQLLAISGVMPKSALPTVDNVFRHLVKEFSRGDIIVQSYTSVLIIVEGVIIAFILALIITFLCIGSSVFASFMDTVSMIMDPIPGVALLSLIMVWFGIGHIAMLVIIILSLIHI